jgi:hypothetical protein
MAEQFDWSAPPLSAEDRVLINAYVESGRTVDDLPYTSELDAIVRATGLAPTDENKRVVLQRLLALRKRGQLPRGIFAA